MTDNQYVNFLYWHGQTKQRTEDTKPELLVRKFLFSRGFRYRLNHPRLPGHPDIVLHKYRTVIFVNGCFWHGHQECKYFLTLTMGHPN